MDEAKDPEVLVTQEAKETVRIKYADDVETGPRPGKTNWRSPLATRRNSQDSISIRSISGNRSVNPANVLPIQYRTISITLEESKAREAEDLKKRPQTNIEFDDLDWHVIPPYEIYQRLSTTPQQGLSNDQVERKLKESGPNVPSAPPSRWFRKLIGYLFGGFGPVLFVASILVFVAWKPLGQPAPAMANLALGIVLAIVFFAQALFAFMQDWSSSRVMASITTMLPDQCTVLRNGTTQNIAGSQIVPGDVICLKMGDKVPADVRLVEVSTDAKFDRSILTGESVPLHGTVDSTDDNYLETTCIGMAGTYVTAGSATGIVVATGDRTVFGRIAKLTSAPKTGLTTLQKEMLYFVALIVGIMLVMIVAVIIIWAAWLRKSHPSWISTTVLIVDCVSVAVAFIPEGLPIAITASLTITAKIMRKNNVLCKSLKTVETLGSVTVICSDKTGTLTKNEMSVTDCMVGKEPTSVRDAVQPTSLVRSSEHSLPEDSGIGKLALVAGLCNEADFDPTTIHLPLSERKTQGNATDQAILRFADSISSTSEMKRRWRSDFRLAFNSKNKFMINVASPVWAADAKTPATEQPILMIKGAPDILLPRCSTTLSQEGHMGDIYDSDRRVIESVKDNWSSQGKRVILVACKVLPKRFSALATASREYEQAILDEATQDLELVGLVGIVDPPREEISGVVTTLRGAGIKIHMVTGDFKLTAQAIASTCGIITNPQRLVDDGSALTISEKIPEAATTGTRPPSSIVLSGPELIGLDDVQWDNLCRYDEIVFARTTPEQKLRIVKEFQARNEIVGMTGDGVNDAPSLKAADIGIAMGSGSAIAIEAADMVLLDSFAAIVEAVKYGRVAYDNLKKTICYLLPAGSFSEFWPVMTNVLFGLPQILSSFLMIIICCFTDCAAATAIAYEKPEADVLLRRPRNARKDRLVDWKLMFQAYGFLGIIETVCSFSMSYWYAQRKGIPFSALWFGFGNVPSNITSAQYTAVLNEASSIYFVNLVVMQWFNLMATRTRRLSILQHPPLFRRSTRNFYLFPAIIFALVVVVIFLYIPKLQSVLSTTSVPAVHYFLPMAFGMGLLLLDEGRKWLARRYPKGLVAKMAW